MTVKMTVSAGGALRPLAKNLIRAAALTQGASVQFQYGGTPAVKSGGERYGCAQRLQESLLAVTPESPLPDAAARELESFALWLAALPDAQSSPELPPLYEVLEETRRQSDYRTAGGPLPAWESFWESWRALYRVPQTFQTTGAGQINEINKSEAEDYLDAHLKTAGEVSYMKHAVDSLLSSIPEDVETILDIGSGPGYVNNLLPADYSILAMDIDEEILRGNSRQTCLGDIMDIPLADRSVDMVMACDMLEHLPDEVLEKGAAELERVSDKYIYLQVPFQEDPLMAFASCPQCGNVWHVNHHKRTFDEKRLRAVLSRDWEPVLIHYTGDVSYRRNGQLAAKMAEKLGWKTYGVAGCVCPNCGAESRIAGESELRLMQRLADYDTASPFPVYSEIGILFCRVGTRAKLPEPERLTRHVREARAVLPVRTDAAPQQVYTRTEQLPGLYLSGCALEETGDVLRFRRLADTEIAWIAVAFPSLKEREDAAVEFIGHLSEPGQVSVGLMGEGGQEQYALAWNWDERDMAWQLPLPGGRSARPVYTKLYFRAQELILRDCRLLGGEKAFTLAYLHEKPSFLSFRDGETEIRLYAPAGESLRLSHSPADWRRITNDLPGRMREAVRLFTDDMRAAVADLPGGDNRRLIEQLLRYDPGPLVPTNTAAPTAASAAPAGQAENRRILAFSLYMEAEMYVYAVGEQAGFRKKLRRRLIKFLKRGKDRLHGWLHRHERLYERLIALGLKDTYQKMKRRILR